MNHRSLALLVSILLLGCGPAAATGPAGGATSPAASATPASSPGSTAGGPPSPSPGPSFRPLASGPRMTLGLVGEAPVIVAADGPPGHVAVLPGATAVEADGTIVAFLIWFGQARGDQVVTLARSPDGRDWTVDPDPIYADLGLGLAPPGPIPSAAMPNPDGSWTLFGWGADPSRRTSFFSWRATAPGPDGPWAVAAGEDRVLPPGPTGAWDDETAAIAAMVQDGNGFAMWYEGQRPGREIRGGIGFATSADGIAWTRDPEPVMAPGQCGASEAVAANEPQVWRRAGGYVMLFSGFADVGSRGTVLAATSPDGRSWSCTGEPLLSEGDIPGSEGIHTIQGVTIGGEPGLLVESLRLGGSEIWLATLDIAP